jgi:hypothetical protein
LASELERRGGAPAPLRLLRLREITLGVQYLTASRKGEALPIAQMLKIGRCLFGEDPTLSVA